MQQKCQKLRKQEANGETGWKRVGVARYGKSIGGVVNKGYQVIIMDHADDGDNNDIFVYMGGRVPQHLRGTITHIRVHKSVKIISAGAFEDCNNLVTIEMHDGVEIIETEAFWGCTSLRGIKLAGVRAIGVMAFYGCEELADVEFGDKLETIGDNSFESCISLKNFKLPSKVSYIGYGAFGDCEQLTEMKLSKDLETIEGYALASCRRLRRIAIPLKDNLLADHVLFECDNLSQVDLVGGIHKTVSSLLLDSWRNEMKDEIDCINQVLPYYDDDKTPAIRQWIRSVLQRIEHYKREHYALLKNNMTQLELALWKANLPNVDAAVREQARVTCGANIIIPHVLSFLNDDDAFPLLNQSAE